MKYIENIKKFLYIPTTQRRGYVVLLILLILILFLPTIYKQFFYKSKIIDITDFANEIESFEHAIKRVNVNHTDKKDVFQFENVELSAAKMSLQPFPFNPNNLSFEDWQKMGFTERQIKGIKNYEVAGGHFKIKTDLKKLFVITDEMYRVLEPYILLPDNYPEQTNLTHKEQTKETRKLELNSADTIALKKLPGIGSYYANAIIKYRTKLGGFNSVHQLLEIYRFDTLRFLQIENLIDVNPFLIKKININTAEIEELKTHPYMTYNVAMSIINFRKMHGNYIRIEDVMKSALINDALFEKLAPYLTTTNEKNE